MSTLHTFGCSITQGFALPDVVAPDPVSLLSIVIVKVVGVGTLVTIYFMSSKSAAL